MHWTETNQVFLNHLRECLKTKECKR